MKRVAILTAAIVLGCNTAAFALDNPKDWGNNPARWPSNWEKQCSTWEHNLNFLNNDKKTRGTFSNIAKNMPGAGPAMSVMIDNAPISRRRDGDIITHQEAVSECNRKKQLYTTYLQQNMRPKNTAIPNSRPNQPARPDTYTQILQRQQAEEAEKRRTMAGSYQACLQSAQYISNLDRIKAAHAQSCQCLLQGKQGVVSPAGDFMGCRN